MLFKFLHLRNRVLHVLLVFFIGLTLFAYYRSTVDNYLPSVQVTRTRQFAARFGHMHETAVDEALLSNKASSIIDPTALVLNNSQQLTEAVSFAYSNGSLSPSSASMSASSMPNNNSQPTTDVKNLNLTMKLQPNNTNLVQNTSVTNLPLTTKPPMKNSVRFIYPPGHSISALHKCPDNGKDMDLVIVITSAPDHVDARDAIRKTWGYYDKESYISILFIIGSTNNSAREDILMKEQDRHNDIIRGKFIDTYKNLTLKSLSIFEWFSTYCQNVNFLLKTDDDMFINVPKLIAFINKRKTAKNVIYGKVAKRWRPVRKIESKYYVSLQQYKDRYYPDFTTGPAYLLKNDVVQKIFDASMDEIYLTLEDVFLTGIVAKKIGIKRSHSSEFVNTRVSLANSCVVKRHISIHKLTFLEKFDLWKKTNAIDSKC